MQIQPRSVKQRFNGTQLILALLVISVSVAAQAPSAFEYRVLATTKTSTMEKGLNEAAQAGFRFQAVMGGETEFGGSEVVAVTSRARDTKAQYAYRLLATSKTSTMQKELQEAADEGFEYRGQTVFKSGFGGEEVICILERDKGTEAQRSEYKLVATSKTSTLEKELSTAGAARYQVLGMTVGKTALGGKKLVAITRKQKTQ
jgi:hypothetical protein